MVLRALEPGTVADEAAATAILHDRGTIDACVPSGPAPDEPLTRIGALRMLLRAWGYVEAPPCAFID